MRNIYKIMPLFLVLFVACGKSKSRILKSTNPIVDNPPATTVNVNEEVYKLNRLNSISQAKKLSEILGSIRALVNANNYGTDLLNLAVNTDELGLDMVECLEENLLPAATIKKCMVENGNLDKSVGDLNKLVEKLAAINILISNELVKLSKDSVKNSNSLISLYILTIQSALKL